TIQNYFRLYEKLAGMTGTAETEASEFNDIYRLGVVTIPTNKPCIRVDENDVIFKTRREKYNNAVAEIQEAHSCGQPLLVGTASVDASEVLSRMLKRANIPHQVLNAKNHQIEADIIANAGQRGAVTIATNMAGRGTDIRLGEGVKELGGLYVLGTERHESRRVDRQLRGRCSRQGDPGRSKFLISLEDDLMRLFANAGPISRLLEKSFKEGEPLEHTLLNRSIGTAQKRVEGQNYSARKRLLHYDDVLNNQREIIYGLRNQAIHDPDPRKLFFSFIADEIITRLHPIFDEKNTLTDDSGLENFFTWVRTTFPVRLGIEELQGLDMESIRKLILEKIETFHKAREEFESPDDLKRIERFTIISSIDNNWQDHLTEMEELRRYVNLRSYAGKDPLNEYKNEAYNCFETMMARVRSDICGGLFRSATSMDAFQGLIQLIQKQIVTTGPEDAPDSLIEAEKTAAKEKKEREAAPPPRTPGITFRREYPKIGRNDVVRIRRGIETQDLKWKKAEAILRADPAWELDEIIHGSNTR
ncbi:MAG: preprotein translocase subunit SecA, partial [Puniceicoccales bacterium]|nr:preprotein translocase subunit SecA [Puniceicoccales bacterium]